MNKLLIKLSIILYSIVVFANRDGGCAQYQDKSSFQDEERILYDLLSNMSDVNKFYVDIGASDGIYMSNTARLAFDGWQGLAVECDAGNINTFLQNYRDLTNIRLFQGKIDPTNVCSVLENFNVPKNFGVLNLDIDSYDYFVLEALLKKFRPEIIIAEINEKLPPPLEFTVLYDKNHVWDASHFYGQSISQLEKLSLEQNYSIVCLEYNNVFLVPKEKYKGKGLTAKEAYLTGYQLKEDRKLKFPWNQDMEILLTLSPEENVRFLEEFFSKYKGKFSLTIP